MDEKRSKKIEKELRALMEALYEKRDDIANEIDTILDGNKFTTANLEDRFIRCDVPSGAVRALYDTHTTLIEFEVPEGSGVSWVVGNNHYYED